MNDDNTNLERLAKTLATNYINVSISDHKECDIEFKDEVEKKLIKVFKSDLQDVLEPKHFIHTRNILIVGNGASDPFTKKTTDIIDEIERKYAYTFRPTHRLPETLKDEWRDFVKNLHGAKKDKHNISWEQSDKETFETRLAALIHCDFIKRGGDKNQNQNNDRIRKESENIIRNYLLEHVYKRIIPNSFYEIVAHLFKHRFIDVIINFNFDEMLDNAIEDELEEKTYLRVIHDRDVIALNQICNNQRLKTPIYIKPHGTISAPDSLLFTREHYSNDISLTMRLFMESILRGKVGDNTEQETNLINIISAGFGFLSHEFNSLLQAVQKSKKIKFYVFDIANKSKAIRRHFNKTPLFIKCDKRNNLSDRFFDLHTKIRNYFDGPYEPIEPIRHDLLTKYFPYKRLKDIDENIFSPIRDANEKITVNNLIQYLENKVKFHLLFDLIKNNGYFATNVSINGRAGKYYQLLLKEHYKHFPDKLYEYNLFTLLKKALPSDKQKENNSLLNISDVAALYVPLRFEDFKEFPNSTNIENFIIEDEKEELIKAMLDLYDICLGKNNDKKIKEYIANKLRLIFNTGLNEISPKYSDAKLGRFLHFKKEQVLTTNLAFTHKFWEFATDPRYKDWKVLWFVDDTGKAIYNLHSKSSGSKEESYLIKNIISDNKIIELLSINKKEIELKKTEEYIFLDPKFQNNKKLVDIAIGDIFLNELKGEHFKPYSLNLRQSFHHMALFLKLENESVSPFLVDNLLPLYGIYFFKPGAKNKINPVYFDHNNGKNDQENLAEMKRLFKLQKDEGKVMEEYYRKMVE